MAYEYEVQRQARKLSDSARNAQNQRSRSGAYVDSADQWWKGKGGEAFIKEYIEADGDAGRFLNAVNAAADQMNRLPQLIRRAEEERRKAAEKKAKAAAEKKNKG